MRVPCAALLALAMTASMAQAQEAYPTRPITIVVAFPPGGLADLTARPVAAALERILKQPVVVANKAGAAGAVGNQTVATSKPDGYTLLMALVSVSVLVGLFVNLLRVPYRLLYPVILVCSILGVYAVNSSVVDVWIMLFTGVPGYVLRKLEFETAPIVLGLVLAPMMELSLRQALAMSGGHYAVFVTRPISLTLLLVGAVLVLLALRPLISRTLDWRSRLPAESEG